MTSDTVVFRFPAEPAEYRLSERKPEEGDVLRRNGDSWVVVSVEEQNDGATVVTLRPATSPA